MWRCHCRISNKTYEQIKRNQIKPTNKSKVETDKPEVATRNRQRRRACELWLGRKRQRDASREKNKEQMCMREFQIPPYKRVFEIYGFVFIKF